MNVKFYKTSRQCGRGYSDVHECRFKILSDMINADVANNRGLSPRILHLADESHFEYCWVVAIVVWE